MLRTFVISGLKVFIPGVYGVWLLRLGADNFDGKQLLIFTPAYLLSLLGIWRMTLLITGLIEPAVDRIEPGTKK